MWLFVIVLNNCLPVIWLVLVVGWLFSDEMFVERRFPLPLMSARE